MNTMPTTVDALAAELITAFSGQAAFLARNLTTGAEFSHRPDVVMPTASTIKLLALAELFQRVDAGDVTLDERVPLVADDVRGGSGILKDLDPGVLLTIRDHATLMIALSDNTSTQLLVRLLGRERILASARRWGLTNTSAHFRAADDAPARDYAASTPRDLVWLLELIATDAIISPAACQGIRDILVTQQYHDQIGRYLPYNQYERSDARHPGPVVVMSKSGFMGGVRVDAGIVQTPTAHYVLCLMNEDSVDVSYLPEQEGAVLNGRISRLIYDAWGQ
jgi:beta-lactamase class A